MIPIWDEETYTRDHTGTVTIEQGPLLTYCFDLDGTLCTTEAEYADAQPIPERIAVVNALYDAGHKIIIDTARCYVLKERLEEIRALTLNQLKLWGVQYHELRIGSKIAADVYVDDKGQNAELFFRDTHD